MARLYALQKADMRAMEKQGVRENPVRRNGYALQGGAGPDVERFQLASERAEEIQENRENPDRKGATPTTGLSRVRGGRMSFFDKQNKVRTPEQQAKHDKKVERINNWNAHLHGGASTGESRSARGAIVKKVMAERGCSLPEASRIVKAEGLY